MPMSLRCRLPLLILLAALTMGHSSPTQTPAKAPASAPLPFSAEDVGIDEKLGQRAAIEAAGKERPSAGSVDDVLAEKRARGAREVGVAQELRRAARHHSRL